MIFILCEGIARLKRREGVTSTFFLLPFVPKIIPTQQAHLTVILLLQNWISLACECLPVSDSWHVGVTGLQDFFLITVFHWVMVSCHSSSGSQECALLDTLEIICHLWFVLTMRNDWGTSLREASLRWVVWATFLDSWPFG